MAHISPELLGILRCPVTGSTLELDGDELVATTPDATGTAPRYSLTEGIPVMLRPADVATAPAQETPTA
ncbi:Trm112 family protein [Arthrobacter sp.]|uniref:Trm112 family protein n=1 Tax=Arthrobacter sp. TaxID=1667 RepID=UPI003A937FC0